jgi:hypothetical protein
MSVTPTPTKTPFSTTAADDAKVVENDLSRFHINGWLALALVIGANVVGVLLHV